LLRSFLMMPDDPQAGFRHDEVIAPRTVLRRKARNAAYPGSLQALQFETIPDNGFAVFGMTKGVQHYP
jgi:hypothetical protein